MKKALFAVFGCFIAASAVAEKPAGDLPIPQITIGGTKIALPMVQSDDGTVCVSYVSEIRLEGAKSVAEVKQHCTISTPVSPA